MTPVRLIAWLASKRIELVAQLKYKARAPVSDEVRRVLKAKQDDLLRHLVMQEAIARLPWQLDRLVRAAGAAQLKITIRGVNDVNAYVLAWAASYLISDQQEALKRLWAVHEVWRSEERMC